MDKQAYGKLLLRRFFRVNTNPKHFKGNLSAYLWEVGFEFEYAHLWMRHDHMIYAMFY